MIEDAKMTGSLLPKLEITHTEGRELALLRDLYAKARECRAARADHYAIEKAEAEKGGPDCYVPSAERRKAVIAWSSAVQRFESVMDELEKFQCETEKC